MTSKQRAHLKSLAMNLDAVFSVGKDSLTDRMIEAIGEHLEANELMKVSVLKNCADDPRELAAAIGEATQSEVVQVIGKKMVFYKQARDPKDRKIVLPK
ncbi:MAG: ribosome assembly RNA-binding protein YhbY [Lachnospiraceae bacterium]|nr:ribosome assembly RNA-binding protein YhbY [Lachnospiraceae bacterium]